MFMSTLGQPAGAVKMAGQRTMSAFRIHIRINSQNIPRYLIDALPCTSSVKQ